MLFNSIQFNSIQFNSIQFNSIPKIISLIALLFILLFSISCKSNENPKNENPKKVLYKVSDIEGTWKNTTASDTFTISSNGDFNLKTSQGNSSSHIIGYDRNREILEGEIYELYLKVKLTAMGGGTEILRLTFNSASNCTASFLGNTEIFIFIKQ